LPPEKMLPNIKFVSVAPLLGDVIKWIYAGKSLGQLLGER